MNIAKTLIVMEGLLSLIGYSQEIELLKVVVKALKDKKLSKEEQAAILAALKDCVIDDEETGESHA